MDEAFAKRDAARVLLDEALDARDAAEALLTRCQETVSIAQANFRFQDKMLGLAIQAEDGK